MYAYLVINLKQRTVQEKISSSLIMITNKTMNLEVYFEYETQDFADESQLSKSIVHNCDLMSNSRRLNK